MKRWIVALLLLSLCLSLSCNQNRGPKQMTIGVSFETLQTEYWVAGFEAIKTELKNATSRWLKPLPMATPTVNSNR